MIFRRAKKHHKVEIATRRPAIAPAYDIVSALPYLADENAALKVARSKARVDFNEEELAALADGAGNPQKLTLKVTRETVDRFRGAWKEGI